MRPFERLRTGPTAVREGGITTRPLSGRAVLAALLVFFGIVVGVNGLMIALAIGTMPGLENEKP